MEIESTDASEAVEPCWPFWGLLFYSERARRPNHTYPLVSFYSKEDEFFNRFDQVAEAALEMLTYRSLDDLRCSAREIQALINFAVESKMEKETEMLVRTLCEHGGYQLSYLPEGSSRTEDDIRELLKNWADEWDDDSGLTPRYIFSDIDELSDYLEHHKYLNKERIQLGLVDPNEHEFYAVLVLMIICNAVHLNRGAQRSSEFFDQAMTIGEASIQAVEALALAKRIQIVNALTSAVTAVTLFKSAIASEQITPIAAVIEKLDSVVTPKTEEVPASGITAAFLAMKRLDAGELSITFVGDKNDLAMGNNSVDVTARGVTKRIPLACLDLVDKRTTALNTQGTILLGLTAQLKLDNTGLNSKKMSRLRRVFTTHFGITRDPFEAYRKGAGWAPRFTIADKRGAADDRARLEGERRTESFEELTERGHQFSEGDDDSDIGTNKWMKKGGHNF